MMFKVKEPKVLLLVTGSILCAILLLWTVHTLSKQPRVGIIHITAIVDNFAKQEGEKKRSPQEVKERAHKFGAELEKTVRDIARRRNLVVFPSEAVLHGGIDITEEVQKRLKPVN